MLSGSGRRTEGIQLRDRFTAMEATSDRSLVFLKLAFQNKMLGHDQILELLEGWDLHEICQLSVMIKNRGWMGDDDICRMDQLVQGFYLNKGVDTIANQTGVETGDRNGLDSNDHGKGQETELSGPLILESEGFGRKSSVKIIETTLDFLEDRKVVGNPSDLYLTIVSTPESQEPEVSGLTTQDEAGRVKDLSEVEDDFRADSLPETPQVSVDKRDQSGTRFVVKRFHAQGGMGEVFLAEDQEITRPVALKMMSAGSNIQNQRQKQFWQAFFLLEGEITGRLDHPGVVPVYGLGSTAGGRPYYAMKFVDSPTLETLIQEYHQAESLSTRSAGQSNQELRNLLGHFRAACLTIQYAHDRGVLHCDIKPANIMTGEYGETFVVDWGLAILSDLNSGTQSSAEPIRSKDPIISNLTINAALHIDQGGQRKFVGGTMAYMAPEHFKCHTMNSISEITPACDLFSLGATLYHLLAGCPMIDAVKIEDDKTKMLRIRDGRFEPPGSVVSQIPRALEAICLKAISVNPEARYKSAKLLADDIDKWLADEPVSAYQEPPMDQARRWANRHRSTVVLGVSTVLFAMIGMLLFGVFQEKNKRDLQLKNDQIVAEHSEAITQKTRAEANAKSMFDRSHMAISFIKKFADDVIQNPELNNRPELSSFRKEMLAGTIGFYKNFQAQLEKDKNVLPESLDALAGGETELGELINAIGNKQDALNVLNASIANYEKLAAANPGNLQFQFRLAHTYKITGSIYEEIGQTQLAFKPLQKALEIIEELLGNHTQNKLYQSEMASILMNLGLHYRATGKAELAEELFQKATKNLQQLAEQFPEDNQMQVDLAIGYQNLGVIHHDLAQYEAARECVLKAVRVMEKLIVTQPGNIDYQIRLSDCYTRVGLVEQAMDLNESAKQSYFKSQIYLEELLRDNPTISKLQRSLAFVYYLNGELIEETQIEPARENFQKSLEILTRLVDENPEVVKDQGQLSQTLKELGNLFAANGQKVQALERYQEALRVQEAIAEKHPEMSHLGPGIGDILEKISALEPDSDKAIEMLLKAVDYQAKALSKLRGYQMFEGFMQKHWIKIAERLPQTANPRKLYPRLANQLADLKKVFPDDKKYQGYEIQLENSYAWFLASKPWHTKEDFAQAVAVAKSALIAGNQDGHVLKTLGVAQYRLGLFAEAIVSLQNSFQLDKSADSGGDQPADLAFLAMCQFKLNKKDEAMESFNRLIKAMEKPSFSNDEESRNFFREASNLIQPMTIPEQPFQD